MNTKQLCAIATICLLTALSLQAQANTFPSSGNVGIGTTTPGAQLEIKGSVGAVRIDSTVVPRIGSNHDGYELNLVGGVPDGTDMGGRIRLGGSTRADATINTISFHQNSVECMRIANGGNVGIGTTTPSHKLSVNGTIRAKEIIVDTNWADYVFAQGYRLAPLSEVEKHIAINGRLPDVPSAKEVSAGGVSLGETQALLLRKIEELTLHLIAQEKEMAKLRSDVARLTAAK